MLHHAPTLEELEWITRVMHLPEPFIWGHHDAAGVLRGCITGYVYNGNVVNVDHLILLPGDPTPFLTLMRMCREATAACHARGLDVVVKIPHADRRTGLRAWAQRLGYVEYAEDAEVRWYRNPAPSARAEAVA